MNTEHFAALLNQDEGSSLEFKRSTSDTAEIGQTVCAFANTAGGQVVFGVHKTGRTFTLAGIGNIDKAQRELQNFIYNAVRPEPRYTFDVVEMDLRSFLIIAVTPSPLHNPCYFKRSLYIRNGSMNIELAGPELVDFLKARGTLSFEEMESPASLIDLDKKKIEKATFLASKLANGHKPLDSAQVLVEQFGVASFIGKKLMIKKSAPLFFAKNIARFQRNAEARVVKFRGKEASVGSVEKDIRILDTLPELLKRIFDVTGDFVGRVAIVREGKRIETPALPELAMREAITNAVGHRDYIDPNSILIEVFDDRLQITNPGSLLPGQTLKNFALTRRHRNPVIHNLINVFGWGEGMGFGVKEMCRLQRANNLPDPIFEDLGGFFRVTLFTARSEKRRTPVDVVSDRQAKALAYLGKHNVLRTKEYAAIVGVSLVTAVHDLNELVVQGKLAKVGKFRGAYYIKSNQQL